MLNSVAQIQPFLLKICFCCEYSRIYDKYILVLCVVLLVGVAFGEEE